MSGAGDFWKLVSIAAAVLAAALAPAGGAVGAELTTLYNFGPISSGDGRVPLGPLAFDQLGALYGTTGGGGAHDMGTVFKLTPPIDPSAPWTERILYGFTGGQDGGQPRAGVIFDKAGNLYGTTFQGGVNGAGCINLGCGTVFQGIPPADPNGPWGGRLIWSFTGIPDGGLPGGLILDDATGVLYGLTGYGGLPSDKCTNIGICGTVFALTPPANPEDPWTYSVIWRFTGGADGGNPTAEVNALWQARLVRDALGALYGTTWTGGAYGHGTLFQLTPGPTGYSLKTIWDFTGGADGYAPTGGLTFNSGGLLFGTNLSGGAFHQGTIFEGFPPSMPDGDWGGRLLWSFTGGADGNGPLGGLVFDPAGNFYGTTHSGGGNCFCGTVFQGIPPATPDGSWGGKVLWTFSGGADGGNPNTLILDAAGTTLYGTNSYIFADRVYKLTP